MRLLLDMNIPVSAAEWLRVEGHDAVHLRELRLERLPDDQIVTLAGAEGRVLITCDLDFADILGATSQTTSVVLLRLKSLGTVFLRQRLQAALSRTEQALADGAIVVVEEMRIRVRSLPIR